MRLTTVDKNASINKILCAERLPLSRLYCVKYDNIKLETANALPKVKNTNGSTMACFVRGSETLPIYVIKATRAPEFNSSSEVNAASEICTIDL